MLQVWGPYGVSPRDVPPIILSQPQHPGGCAASTQRLSPAAARTTEGTETSSSSLWPTIIRSSLWVIGVFLWQKNVMKTTWGVLDPPVGNTRLNVVRLVASLLQCNNHSINTELINLNTLGVILVSNICHATQQKAVQQQSTVEMLW